MDKVLAAYRQLAQIPALSGARVYKNGSTVISTWSERNLEKNKTTKICLTQHLDTNLNIVSETPFGTDSSNELISSISPQETMRAVVREPKDDPKEAKKQYLEIWKYRHMENCIDLAALDIHGDVYTDTEFGSFNWDASEQRIIYIAEKKLPKCEPFYKRGKVTPKEEEEKKESPTAKKGCEYEYKQEWGEQLVGKHKSVIVVCEVGTEAFTVVDWLPESWCPAQVSFSPDGQTIAGVAWETEPRRLGLIFCTNRPSYVFTATLDGKYSVVSEKGKAVRGVKFSGDGKQLVWLQREAGGAHHCCHQLVKTAFPLQEQPIIETIIDIVDTEIPIEGDVKFTGLYNQGFTDRAFSSDGKRLILSTPQITENRSFVVDIESGKITDISEKSSPGSTTILDVNQDFILAGKSSLKQPAQLMIAKLPAPGSESSIQWKTISTESVALPDIVSSANMQYLDLKYQNEQDAVNNFSAIFLGAGSESSKQPLIVWPHGGPHSCFVNAFSLESALFCVLGFSMVQINYRGSIGAGEASVKFLPGKVGSSDVLDCITAMERSIQLFPVDKEKLVLRGGSHGGFLVTHLSGQYPDRWKAVIALNPVIDVASMFNSSDIPDWCSLEAGSEFVEVGPVSQELLLAMRKVSPLVHAHKVTAPTLLALGSKDKRVPYYQGLEYHQRLKANACKTRVLIYDDNHSLRAGPNEIDELINSALWLLEHTQT